MFFRKTKTGIQHPSDPHDSDGFDPLVAFAHDLLSQPIPPFRIRSEEERKEDEENQKRRRWFADRLWHNGPHHHCCPRCLQAGYVIALVRVGRLDLLGEFPELIVVYEELQRDGMLRPEVVKRG